MPGPTEISGVWNNFVNNMFSSSSAQYMLYFGYFMWAVFIGIVMWMFYLWLMYKYKVTILEGSIEEDKDGNKSLRVLRTRRDRACKIKDEGVDKWRLLFTWKKKIKPVENKYINPGNHVFLFRTGTDTFNPIRMSIGNPSANFVVEPFDQAYFNLGVQQDAKEYQREDVLKKAQVTFLVGMILVVALAAFILWLSFRTAGNTADKISLVTQTWQNIKGIAPN